MRISRRCIGACAAVACLLAAAPAFGADRPRFNAPPGNSGVTEYLETVPTGSGGRRTNGLVPPPGQFAPFDSRSGRALASAGPEGQSALDVGRATAPPEPRRIRRGAADAPAVPNALLDTALAGSGEGGMGAFFPLILAAALGGALAYAIGRRRTG